MLKFLGKPLRMTFVLSLENSESWTLNTGMFLLISTEHQFLLFLLMRKAAQSS